MTSDEALENDLDNALDDVLKDNLDDALENNLEEAPAINSDDNNITSDYDVILQVKPEKYLKSKLK